MTVGVVDVNEAPTLTSGASGSVAENAAASTVIYTAVATDVDAGANGNVVYSLTGADAGLLSINAAGEVTLLAPANFETKNSYSFNVVATDGGTPALTDSKAVTVGVVDVNEAPTAVVLSNPLTNIDENTSTAVHIKVADIAVTDDVLGTNVLSLSGADALNFEIVGNALYLKAGVTLDYETKTSYAVSVNVNDATVGGNPDATQSFTLTVNNLPEGVAATDLKFTANDVSGNSLPSGAVGSFAFTDIDGGGAHTYSMVASSVFTLNASTGVLSAAGMSDNTNYQLDVTVAQAGATSYTETFHIITGTNAIETITGANGEDVIYTEGNNDIVFAGSGNDTVFGQSGNDQMHGGDGNDVLYGAAGTDTFFFDTALNATTNVDTIMDFNSGTDKIHLENTGAGLFNALATGALSAGALDIAGDLTAATANTRIIYDPSSGALYYDADGAGGNAAVQFATLGTTTHPGTVVLSDFVVI